MIDSAKALFALNSETRKFHWSHNMKHDYIHSINHSALSKTSWAKDTVELHLKRNTACKFRITKYRTMLQNIVQNAVGRKIFTTL